MLAFNLIKNTSFVNLMKCPLRHLSILRMKRRFWMRFNKHLHLRGGHAFLSPSSYHWINYSPDRLVERWQNAQDGAYGILQHDIACREIRAGRLSNLAGTIGMYINDAINHRMVPEQILFYSENCFGTADAISFRYNLLKI